MTVIDRINIKTITDTPFFNSLKLEISAVFLTYRGYKNLVDENFNAVKWGANEG